MHLFSKQRHKKVFLQRGFTLVESLVAISILLFAIVAPMTLASNGLQASRDARDQVVSFYLAQEAIDYIRSMRDTNALKGSNWLSGLSACLNGTCLVDVFNTATPIQDCSNCDTSLRFNTARGYTHGSGNATTLTRTVTMTEIVPNEAVRVRATVSWDAGLRRRSLTQEMVLFNWHIN